MGNPYYKAPPFGHGALFERSVPAVPVSDKAALALTVHGLAQGEDETAGETRRAALSWSTFKQAHSV